MSEMICYCFGFTRADIEHDVGRHAKSTIMEKIIAAKQGGSCQCGEKNPKGR